MIPSLVLFFILLNDYYNFNWNLKKKCLYWTSQILSEIVLQYVNPDVIVDSFFRSNFFFFLVILFHLLPLVLCSMRIAVEEILLRIVKKACTVLVVVRNFSFKKRKKTYFALLEQG